MQQPKKRSQLRRWCGQIYYEIYKCIYWHASRVRFAKHDPSVKLPVEISGHQSLLRRKLLDVDMWLQENKITNLQRAVTQIDGIVLQPGEVFSYWRAIGKPTAKKGYLPGMVLHDGKVLTGVGGGLCQLSNLLYWITLHSPLTVIERWRHSYDVFPDSKRKQPFGSGATCAYPYIDLQIKNTTNQPFQLRVHVGKTHLQGSWYAEKAIPHKYKIVEEDHKITTEWWGGTIRHNRLFKETYNAEDGTLLSKEQVAHNQAIMMYNPFLAETKPVSFPKAD